MKTQTCVSIVLEALVKADDFRSVPQLVETTRLSTNQVTASLFDLRKHRAADALVVEGEGTYWFATPNFDTRAFKCKTYPDDVKRPRAPGAKRKKEKPQ